MTPTEATRPPSLFRRIALAEILLEGVEVTVVVLPVLFFMHQAISRGGIGTSVLVVAIAAWLASVMRLFVGLGPLRRVRDNKRRGEAITPADAEAAQSVVLRAPVENAHLHWLIWTAGVATLAVMLLRWGALGPVGALAVSAVTFVHAGAAAAARALVVERILYRVRRATLPNVDLLRAFAGTYKSRLCHTSLALLGATNAVVWVLAAVFAELDPIRVAPMVALSLPALCVTGLFWAKGLVSRLRAIEAYLDVAVRNPGVRGPARDDPTAVRAFRAAQGLPYSMAVYQGIAVLSSAHVVIAAGHQCGAVEGGTALRLLAATALVALAVGLYQTLLLRDVLRPLLGQLGARHRLPASEVRSPLTLRTKLVGFFGGVTVFTTGLVLLLAFSPARDPVTLVGSALLGGALALGLILLILRDIVTPIRALEARSEEMARGELARPVPPSGEADEIGRLTFAFEEMRRALRDKLRSTESLNIDLEREVQRRTEALEQRNKELFDALEKLRRAQDEMVRSEKLASMGRLVAGIAHEINNPVNAVINTLGPVQERLRQVEAAGDLATAVATAREVQEMLGVIDRGASRTKAIVQALHNYSRGDEATAREMNLVRSIDDTVDLLRHRLKNIEVERELEADVKIAAFAGQIDQVIMNLVTNAAQAIGDRGGHIRISTRKTDGRVLLSVSDDGPGIPPEIRARIFDPFFTTKDVGEGSGLGLSIVHGIVERHGGQIEVESEIGKGTTFRVWLPLPSPAAPVTGDAPQP